MTTPSFHPFIPLHSRSYELPSFSATGRCFIKRDDELSAGISGTKCRKYASIVPFLKSNHFNHVHLIGSTHSNNILAACQCLKEHQIDYRALLLKPHGNRHSGNFKLSQLFLSEEKIYWVDRQDWPAVNVLGQQLADNYSQPSYLLPEGSSIAAAIDGAMTLGQDIVKNEQQLGISFDQIFIDAGTGFSASCLIKYLNQINHSAQIYILLLADDSEAFIERHKNWTKASLNNSTLLRPTTAKSFGAVNSTIKHYLRQFAYHYGVLLDPLYSAKLFYESQKYIERHKIGGNSLIIHSGGTLSLPYFDL